MEADGNFIPGRVIVLLHTRASLVISPSCFDATGLVLQLVAALPWLDQNKIRSSRAASSQYNVNGCAGVSSVCNVVMCNGSKPKNISHIMKKYSSSFLTSFYKYKLPKFLKVDWLEANLSH